MRPASSRLTPVALAMAAALTLAACATPPAPPPPATPVPEHFKEDGPWKQAHGDVQRVPDRWWTLFGDPVLDALEERLVIDNEGLKAAVAQVAAAQAALRSAEAAQGPTLGLQADASRAAAPTATGRRNTANTYTMGAEASWEVDLWGRLRQATQAAQARATASAQDLAAARLSASATLAETYFALRTAEAQAALLARTEEADQRVLQLTRSRHEAGVVAESDVLQARTQLDTIKAQREEAQLQRTQLEHALAVLVGRAPSDFTLDAGELPAQTPRVPELLPATLLERRPDIAAAQARVAAAWHDIGAADAAYFPDVSLSGSAGYKSATLSRLVSAPNLVWALGASITQAVFDGGARDAARASARANADIAAANYRQAVLTAFQEVEDNLAAAQALQREAALQGQALDAAQRNVLVTEAQYRAGTVSFLNLASAQAAELSARSTLVQLRQRELAAVATLLKNIAGRWA